MATKKKTTYSEIEPEKKLVVPSHIKGKKYYLYAHLRNDTDKVFYFGVGTSEKNKYYFRAMCYRKRSEFWKRVANKTGYTVIIVEESDNKQDVLDREIQYIKLMGKRCNKTGCLVNFTDGGEGLKGHSVKWTKEMRAAHSEIMRNRVCKDSTRDKLRNNIYNNPKLIGRKGKDSYVAKVVQQICPTTLNILEEFYGCAEAARFIGVSGQSINNAVRFNKKCKNYIWRYKNG